jgi:hypothetical protein
MLVIATPAMQTQPGETLLKLGFEPHGVPDPYAAIAELMSAKSAYRGCVLSLQSIYREELAIVGTLKRRLPGIEIWLAHTDGRHAAMAEAMRLGADGLLGEEGLHRIASTQPAPENTISTMAPFAPILPPAPVDPVHLPQSPLSFTQNDLKSETPEEEMPVSEPVLTADELRALLQEQPSMPPSGGNEN